MTDRPGAVLFEAVMRPARPLEQRGNGGDCWIGRRLPPFQVSCVRGEQRTHYSSELGGPFQLA